jgi:hypothetical protein
MGDNFYDNLADKFNDSQIDRIPYTDVFDDMQGDALARGVTTGVAVGGAGVLGLRALAKRKRQADLSRGPIMSKLVKLKHTLLAKKAEGDDMDLLDKFAAAESYSDALDIFEQLANDYSEEEREVIASAVLEKMSGSFVNDVYVPDVPEALVDNPGAPLLAAAGVGAVGGAVLNNVRRNAKDAKLLRRLKQAGTVEDTLEKFASVDSLTEALELFEKAAEELSVEELDKLAAELLEKEAISLAPIGRLFSGFRGAVGGGLRGASRYLGARSAMKTGLKAGIDTTMGGAAATKLNQVTNTVNRGFFGNIGAGASKGANLAVNNYNQAYQAKNFAKFDKMTNLSRVKQPAAGMGVAPGAGTGAASGTSAAAEVVTDHPTYTAWKADNKTRVSKADMANWTNGQRQEFDTYLSGLRGSRSPKGPTPKESTPSGSPPKEPTPPGTNPAVNKANDMFNNATKWIGDHPYMSTAIGAGAGYMLSNKQQPRYY